jgi:crotonobetainyl-CoA:carnitine CoA-transferase CaiB-like acyl-CoA transferase
MSALDGILVVALEQAVAAPICTQRLADAGARVIKIERPEGDIARHYDQAVKGTSAYFAWANRGKESIVLDVKQAGDLALLKRMVAKADVFIQNFAPKAALRLGLGGKDLLAQHPRLIAVDIVGYGQDTAYRDMRAYDMLVQAESGICAVTGTPEAPSKVGVSIADTAAGMNAHAAVLEALIARGRDGKGRAIEIALFDGMADWMNVPLMHYAYQGKVTERHGLSHASIYPYAPYRCRDGEIVISIQSHGEWERLCRNALEKPQLIADPRFADNPSRVVNREALGKEVAEVFARYTVKAMVERLEAAKIAWARVSGVADLAAHPALRRITVDSPGGSFEAAASALHPELQAKPVPALGQHSEAIRGEFGEA